MTKKLNKKKLNRKKLNKKKLNRKKLNKKTMEKCVNRSPNVKIVINVTLEPSRIMNFHFRLLYMRADSRYFDFAVLLSEALHGDIILCVYELRQCEVCSSVKTVIYY